MRAINQNRTKAVVVLLILAMVLTMPMTGTAYADLDEPVSYIGYKLGTDTVHMSPGRSGTVEDGNGRVISRWALDTDGYFVISVDKPGEYQFRFLDLNKWSQDCTFGVTVIGAGGGGGGAHIDPQEPDGISEEWNKKLDGVGAGGSGGDVVRVDWDEDGQGLKIADYTELIDLNVGVGGKGGSGFFYCKCGGTACPIGGRDECPIARSDNNGEAGGDSCFGTYVAKGGDGGIGGENTAGRYSGAAASSGDYGDNAGEYVFWGVAVTCGTPGSGGCFGVNNGSAGNPYIFHFGYNSFGHSGITFGGKGNGGAGGGMTYAYGHPMVTGTGTGTGQGSYSPTTKGTETDGGDNDSINGYVYIEGKVNLEENAKRTTRMQLLAHVLPNTVDPIPKLTWSSSNASIAKVSQFGSVVLGESGTAVITATAPNKVQGCYFVDNVADSYSVAGTAINIVVDGQVSKVGDSAQLRAVLVPQSNQIVAWNTTNPTVAYVDQEGMLVAKSNGSTIITASTPDGGHAEMVVIIGNGAKGKYNMATYMNLTAPSTNVEVGDSVKMTLQCYPSNNFIGYWYNNNQSVASFDEDTKTITFLKEGVVTLTAKSVNGGTASWSFSVGAEGSSEEDENAKKADDIFNSLPDAITDMDVPQEAEEGRSYTVKNGDSLATLVVKTYGHPAYLDAVVALNNQKANDVSSGYDDINENDPEIVGGQKIYLPTIEELESWLRENK